MKLAHNSIEWSESFKYRAVIFHVGRKCKTNIDTNKQKYSVSSNSVLGDSLMKKRIYSNRKVLSCMSDLFPVSGEFSLICTKWVYVPIAPMRRG